MFAFLSMANIKQIFSAPFAAAVNKIINPDKKFIDNHNRISNQDLLQGTIKC